MALTVDLTVVEDVARALYIRALKVLPPDVKAGFTRLAASETAPTAKRVLATMVENIAVAERTDNLLCQDTGVPIYNVAIGRNVTVDGHGLKAAIRAGFSSQTGAIAAKATAIEEIPGLLPWSDDFSNLFQILK